VNSLDDAMKQMANGISRDPTQTSLTTDQPGICQLCGSTSNICEGLGMIRYDVPVDDPRFGKLFRCPNNPAQQDESWQQRLRRISNLSAFADKTIENFQIGMTMHTEAEQQSLVLARSTAEDFAQNPEGWLLLEGTYGCGKTHLAAAIGNIRLQLGDSVLFITVPDLLDHLRSAYGPSSEIGYDETFDRVRNAHLLILDDLGVENPSPWAQEKLFQLLNYRYSHHLPTVITTNTDIDTIDPRIRSRLLDVSLIRRLKISAPDYRSLVQNEQGQLQSNLTHYADMRFDTFNVHEHVTPEEKNNLSRSLKITRSYAENPAGWLLLIGGYGTGKTHLAAAIANFWRDRGEEVMFLTVSDLLDYLRTTFNPQTQVSFDQRFHAIKHVPFLILDDLGTEGGSAWTKEKLFQLLDFRYVTRMSTVITSAMALEEHNQRIATRLMDERRCFIQVITARSYAMRRKRV
jgi:DNA replication protein DnaC